VPRSLRKRAARATRAQWEVALAEIEAFPAKASEDISAQFLPKFIAALRANGCARDEIVQRLLRERGE